MEYIGDTDRTLQFLVLYKEKTAVLSPSGEAGEGGGGLGVLLVAAQQSFILGGSTPRFNLLPRLYTIFNRKGTPTFCIPFSDKRDPFHTPSLELNISFNCYKCTLFKL